MGKIHTFSRFFKWKMSLINFVTSVFQLGEILTFTFTFTGFLWQVSKEREEIQERFSTAILEIQQKAGLK